MLDLPTPPPSPNSSGLCAPEDRLGLILAGRIQLTGIIGIGAYGTVYRARDIETNVQYAVKTLTKVGLDSRQRTFQEREVELHYQASQHPNVVSMLKILDGPECTYVVIEYCPEGDLFAKITEEGHYVGDDYKAKCVFLQILDAVRHCHANGVYHRDLKPENILVQDDGWTVKLADFGLATRDRITTDFGCGSTFYMSPECQQSDPKPYSCYASAPNDVWSLGVVLVNLTCGRNPWKRASSDDSTFRAFMRDGTFLQSILPISADLNYILQRVFDINPQRRISLDELRDLIVRCPTFTGEPSNHSTPPTPPYSPLVHLVNASLAVSGAPSEVPPMDPLPVPQYPTMALNNFDPASCAGPYNNLPLTPPGSNVPSPQLGPYAGAVKPGAPVSCPAYGPSAGFAPSAAWSKCGQLIANFYTPPNLYTPRSSCFWTTAY